MARQQSRGRKTSKAGRPPKWSTSQTKSIRVPAYLAQKLLEVAQELDTGLHEPMIIQPGDFNVSRQEKKASLALRDIRIYRAAGQDVVRINELFAVLADALESNQ